MIETKRIEKLHQVCLDKEVGFQLTFEAGNWEWSVEIISVAPAERYQTRSCSNIEHALDSAITWTRGIGEHRNG